MHPCAITIPCLLRRIMGTVPVALEITPQRL